MAASPLAPHAPRMTATAPDHISVGSPKVPDGFKVGLWARGVPGARTMAKGPNGMSSSAPAPPGVYAARRSPRWRTIWRSGSAPPRCHTTFPNGGHAT